MLEQHTELIERLLHGSSTRTQEFNQGWSFTNDGTLYFSVWEEDESTFFSWSERQPSKGIVLDTDCDSVAAYALTIELGSMRAMALPFDMPRFPRKISQLPPSWAADKTQQPPTLHTTAPTMHACTSTAPRSSTVYPSPTRCNTTSKPSSRNT